MKKLHRVPPSPDVISQLYADYLRLPDAGGINFKQYLSSIGFTNPAANFVGMDDGAQAQRSEENEGLQLIRIPDKPIIGKLRIKVLLIDFPDQPSSLPVSHYQQLLFSKNTHPTGSLRDYFKEVTVGKVDLQGSINGWLRMPNDYSFYTNNESGTEWNSYPRNAPKMVEDAVTTALAAGVEFEPELDLFKNGTVSALFIIHAGLGAETIASDDRGNQIWSHKWMIRNAIEVAPNLAVSTYLTVPNDAKVGVCAHELGHLAFQWEDFYDPNYGTDGKEWDGAGSWDVMASGSYNGNGNRPCHPAGLHKMQHTWIEIKEVKTSGSFTIPPYTQTSGELIKVVSNKYRSGQYLLLENRMKSGFDSDLPGEGLLVWRVDEAADMFTPEKPALLLVQADGRRQLETPNDWNTGDAGDPFPGSANRFSLDDTGVISTSFPDGDDSGVSLKNIQRDALTGIISVDIAFEGDQISTTELINREVLVNKTIPDNRSDGIQSTIELSQTGTVRQIAVSIDIAHSYIGDLTVKIISPTGTAIVLHKNEGGATENLVKTYSSTTSAELADLQGSNIQGNWKLHVIDEASDDIGTLVKWSIAIDVDIATPLVTGQISPKLKIPDNDPAGIGSSIRLPRAGTVRSLKVNIDITHSYKGDLRVELINPSGTRVILHNNVGGSEDDVIETYSSTQSSVLVPMIGQSANGNWTLRVADLAGADTGILNSWSIEAELNSASSQVQKENTKTMSIPDNDTAGIGSSLAFSEQGIVQNIELIADIRHPYIGDLRIELIAPSGAGAVLHNKSGGRSRDLALALNSGAESELGNLSGESLQGSWILRIADLEGEDVGSLESWSMNIRYAE